MAIRFTLLYLIILSPFLLRAQAPVEFIQNQGQWDGAFNYKASTGKGDVYLEPKSFTYKVEANDNKNILDAHHHGLQSGPVTLKYHAYRVTFEGALNAEIAGGKPQKTYYNYFLGNDPNKWKTGIHPFLSVDYNDLYAGINMHVSSETGNVIYDFLVAPNADAGQIKMKYEGADALNLKKGDLVITTSVGSIVELKPYAYQNINDARKEVPCRYALKNNVVTFYFPDGYDHSQQLVIDPTIVFSTFTGSTADNWGFTATYDPAGNFYAGGIVNGTGYPISLGAYQTTFLGGNSVDGSKYPCDMGIIKFDPTGSTRIYATYIGGSSNEQPHSLIVDASNNLIIAGRTYSANYPVTSGVYSATKSGGSDIVITKLNAAGTALLASTFIGGSGDDVVNFNADEQIYGNLKHNYGDDARSEVQIDKAGNIYVAACTKSTNFPTLNAYQSSLRGTQDGVVFKLNSTLTTLLWSTYLGGTLDDAAYVLAFDSAQSHLYVAGGTQSSNFISTGNSTLGSFKPTYQGGSSDGWIAKFLNSGTYLLQRFTHIGTADYDQCYGIQVDKQNNVYAMGQTLGGTFPVSAGVYSNAGSSQFVIKLDSNLTTNIKSTVFGSGTSTLTNISPVALLVDTCDNIYISGWGGDLTRNFGNGPTPGVGTTTGMPYTSNASDTVTDGSDFYFIVLSKNMANLVYATFYGRKSANLGKGEHVDGGTSRFDKNGIIYQAICGGCSGDGTTTVTTAFPTTAGSWSPGNGFPTNCNEVALKIAFNLGTVNASAAAGPTTAGCAPLTVNFTNASVNAVSYSWDFGDGSPVQTTATPTHTYTKAGTYIVKLAAINANACSKTSDTARITITVKSGTGITSAFTYVKTDSCGPYKVSFTNTSTGATASTTYVWDLGDGTKYTGVTPPAHTYTGTGTYSVTLTMTDTSSCNPLDSVRHTFSFTNLNVKAGFNLVDTVCQGVPVVITNTSTFGQTYQWSFGNGQGATTAVPALTYGVPGVYTVKLVVKNTGSCNKTDSFTKTIVVLAGPTADFSFNPTIPITNTPINFTNLSVNASKYLWDFGDSKTSAETNPSHLYQRSGRFSVCLTATNGGGCPSTLCKTVSTDIVPLADLPTAFTPNGDGNNDILYVRGADITSMDLKIWNRWGQLVFESTDQQIGWDGTFNGKPQEMEAYGYVLKVMFGDGTTLEKKGNITLLR